MINEDRVYYEGWISGAAWADMERIGATERAAAVTTASCGHYWLNEEWSGCPVCAMKEGLAIRIGDLVQRAERAEARLEAAERDVARLDWLIAHEDVEMILWGVDRSGMNPSSKAFTSRESIDAGMRGETKP